MSEYIKKDYLITLMQIFRMAYHGSIEFNKRYRATDVYMNILDLIDNAEVADVKPVVHGEWIPLEDIDKDNNQLFECNQCHHSDLHAVGVDVPYCWFCGAEMKNNMRSATAEEVKSVSDYIENISNPTGVQFYDNCRVETRGEEDEHKDLC